MSLHKLALALALLLGASFAVRPTYAEIPVPAGMSPGDTYQLVFNSSTTTNALSSDINFYNSFVQAAADAAGLGASESVTWRAIASTASIDARGNAVVGANTPVYNMKLGQQEKIADGFNDLWDGSLDSIPAYDEFGQLRTLDPWTGSLPSGLRAAGSTLGHASGTAWCGRPSLINGNWITFFEPSTQSLLAVYALSETITVTDADFNQDNQVDGLDFLAWQRGVGGPASLANGDANGDGNVDGADLAIWEQSYGEEVTFNAAAILAVPEPSAALLVAIGLIVAASGHHRLPKPSLTVSGQVIFANRV